jgi:ssDNA-binding Zn-finger/Zn-ribbon topoisomerase 1
MADTSEMVKKSFEAMRLIAESGKKQGSIPCPKCGGDLRFSVASNGHQLAKCGSPNCIAYMQ